MQIDGANIERWKREIFMNWWTLTLRIVLGALVTGSAAIGGYLTLTAPAFNERLMGVLALTASSILFSSFVVAEMVAARSKPDSGGG